MLTGVNNKNCHLLRVSWIVIIVKCENHGIIVLTELWAKHHQSSFQVASTDSNSFSSFEKEQSVFRFSACARAERVRLFYKDIKKSSDEQYFP